jgi:N utilization substance protein A
MISVLEESFRSVIAKMNGTDENFDIIINPDKGDLEIWRNRTVVEDDPTRRSQHGNHLIGGSQN